MLRASDDLYSAADYQPITDEHFLRRCSAPVDGVQYDDDQDDIGSDDWQWIDLNFH